MATWVKLGQTITATGEPNQFFTGPSNSAYPGGEVFLVAALRVSGGADGTMPRRLIGMGVTREAAGRSLDDAFSRYDPTYRLIPSR